MALCTPTCCYWKKVGRGLLGQPADNQHHKGGKHHHHHHHRPKFVKVCGSAPGDTCQKCSNWDSVEQCKKRCCKRRRHHHKKHGHKGHGHGHKG